MAVTPEGSELVTERETGELKPLMDVRVTVYVC